MNTHPTLRQSLAALPRPVWILFAGSFLNKFGAFVIPFLAIYLTSRGYTSGDAALALSSYGAGHLTASLLGGYLADRIGRRKTIAISMFASAIFMILLSQAESLWLIVLLTGLTGLGAELYRPACSALLADLVPSELRVTAFAAYRLSINAGFAFGPATAGFLAKHSFLWLFLGDAVTSALFGLLAWAALPHGVRTSGRDASWGETIRVLRTDRQFHIILVATLAIATVFLQLFSTFGLNVTSHGFSPTAYGALISMNGVIIVLLELPLTIVTRRLPPRPTIAAGYALIGVAFAGLAYAATLPALALVVVTFTFGEMIAMPVGAAYIADNVPTTMRGRYMGVYGLMWALGLVCGPGAGVKLFATAPATLWGACGALGLFAAVMMLFSKPRKVPAGAQAALS